MDSQVNVDRVRVEGLVLLKIIKHCQDEQLSSQDCVNGILLGLAVENELQITNCFPLPKMSEDDPTAPESLSIFESDMIKNLRQFNNDYLNVGLYQSGSGGLMFHRANLDNVYQYQSQISEAVLLICDSSKTSRGQIGLKAYRLSSDVLKYMSDAEDNFKTSGNAKGVDASWEVEAAVSSGRTNFTRFFDEIPVVIHNSNLVNILLNDIDETQISSKRKSHQSPMLSMAPPIIPDTSSSSMFIGLDLSMTSSLEQQLRFVLGGLETINDYQYTYHRSLSKYQGQAKIPAEQRNRELAPIKLDTALISAQLNLYCGGLSQMAGQTVGKLMLTQAVHRSRQA